MARHRRGNMKFYENFSRYVPGVKGLFMLILMFLVGVLIGNVFAFIVGGNSELTMLIAYPLMFIPMMIYASLQSRSASLTSTGVMMNSSNFGGKSALVLALITILMTVSAAFCMEAPMKLMPSMPEWLETVMKSMTQGTFWVNFLCVSIFAPFFEEWLCRGMVLRGLLYNKMRPVWAIVISAFFFALIHANPWQAIPAFGFGCLFGYVYYKTGSLVLTMLMHFTNNTVSLILSNIDSLKDFESFLDIMPAYQYWLFFALGILILTLSVLIFARIPKKYPEGNCDKIESLFAQQI